jgi:undecaprenyl-diphosphatase
LDVLQAIVLGIVQGLTEFAPVSSSAHLVLVPWFLHWPAPTLTFDTTLHLGTLLAVVVYFWRDIWDLIRAFFASLRDRNLAGEPLKKVAWLLIVATIPAALAGALFKDFFEALFEQPLYVGILLLVTAATLFMSERVAARARGLERLTLADSLVIGVAQAAAIAPGISRSGATMSGGLVMGLTRIAAARFSFLLSIPIIFGAGVMQLRQVVKGAEPTPLVLLAIGFIVSAVTGYLCIRFLMRYLQNRTLNVFAAYCAALGLATMAVYLAGWR